MNLANIRRCLQQFDFRTLFLQELGWDRPAGGLSVVVDGRTFDLQAVAEKRGFQVFAYTADDGSPPDYATRCKIERQAARLAHEHLIVYTDAARTAQKWQWVRRELGRPLARREYDYHKGHTGEALAQKLQGLAVELAEEEDLTIVHVGNRVRQALDVDRVTRRFYDRFQTEHAAFLTFLKGVPADGDAAWYASLMLNRLMFIYFIQKKNFLDGDPDYLRNRLRRVGALKGKDKFHTFYRYFLLRLFHEGLGQQPARRKKDLDELLGKRPLPQRRPVRRAPTGADLPRNPDRRRGLCAAVRLLRRLPLAPRRAAAAGRQRDQSRRARLHLREVHQPEADGRLLHQGGHHRLHRPQHHPSLPLQRRRKAVRHRLPKRRRPVAPARRRPRPIHP